MPSALSDIRVLDLSRDVAGAFCARLMGDFGADVIKVEPRGGDPCRGLAPLKDGAPGDGQSILFAYLNTNKRGITLDIESPGGASLLHGLACKTDVVVESFAPGYLDALGAGFDGLETLRPGIILTSITPYGQTGPWRDREGNDLTAFALSGWASLNSSAGGPPLKGSGHQASYVGGLAGFFGTLSALVYRDRHGVGQQVDVSILEALTEIYGPRFLQAQHTGVDGGGRERDDFMGGPVPCQDGYFSLTLSRAHFWRDAMNELGLPELADAEHFWGRQGHRAELAARVEPKIARRGKYELFEALSTLRVVSGMVLTTEELYANPHLLERGFFVEVDQPGLGRVEMPGAPFKMGATAFEIRRPAPRLGEHTSEVLEELLGLSDAGLEELRKDRAL